MTTTLNVLPNPYSFIDAKGRPAGAVLEEFDPKIARHGAQLRYVGARATGVVVQKSSGLEGDKGGEQVRGAITDLTFEFSDKPVSVRNTQYYREQILAGNLIPADADTAKAANIKTKFVEPQEALSKAKARAIAEHLARYGEKPPFAKEK